MTFFKNRLNRGAIRIAGGSLLIGNLLFLIYLAFPIEPIVGVCLAFIVLFIAIHVLLLATLTLNSLIRIRDYEENLTAFIISFLNIPLTFLYLNFI